jgi:hypothetical protein
LHLFPLIEVLVPESLADLPLAMWRLEVGLETLERKRRGELFCILCDSPIALDLPPIVGFVKPDESSRLCGFSVCEACFLATETREELTNMVGEAFGGTIAPNPSWFTGLSSAHLRRVASRSPSATQLGRAAALRNLTTGLGASCASSVDNSAASVMIRFSRCSCVIHPPLASHAPDDRREHLPGDASSADLNTNLARRIVGFDDQALPSPRDGLAA